MLWIFPALTLECIWLDAVAARVEGPRLLRWFGFYMLLGTVFAMGTMPATGYIIYATLFYFFSSGEVGTPLSELPEDGDDKQEVQLEELS
jgi:hypothetical protein